MLHIVVKDHMAENTASCLPKIAPTSIHCHTILFFNPKATQHI